MQWLTKQTEGLAKLLNVIAGCALTFMMLLTVMDVILRFFRMPIVGTYELVAFAGGVVIGFSVPMTSFKKGHILVDFFIMRFSHRTRWLFHLITRLMGLGLFIILGWNMILMGMDMLRTGEVSLTLELPFYPVVFGIGFACLVQCLVTLTQIFQGIGGTND
jgi:TRAP-type C4-dicarboxylate transport system permease small subunit